jgi:hypothetical protein
MEKGNVTFCPPLAKKLCSFKVRRLTPSVLLGRQVDGHAHGALLEKPQHSGCHFAHQKYHTDSADVEIELFCPESNSALKNNAMGS